MTSEASASCVCPAGHAGWLSTPLRRLLTDPRRLLKGLVEPGDVVADLGCGPGFFTLPMAEAVGDGGMVIAVDLQAAMLDKLRERASRSGVMTRIRSHQCGADSLGLSGVAVADFALVFWMLHEVPDPAHFLAEVHALLRPGGRLLLVEPRGHVTETGWKRTMQDTTAAGFALTARPRVAFSRAALFERPAA